jgi:5-methylcytosine-specific restriction endonuclease McrA
MSPRLRACITCGRISSTPRCPEHTRKKPYSTAEYRVARAQTLAEEKVCWICGGEPTTDDPLVADHLLPTSDGGKSTRSNMHAAHLRCNARRGAIRGNNG